MDSKRSDSTLKDSANGTGKLGTLWWIWNHRSLSGPRFLSDLNPTFPISLCVSAILAVLCVPSTWQPQSCLRDLSEIFAQPGTPLSFQGRLLPDNYILV